LSGCWSNYNCNSNCFFGDPPRKSLSPQPQKINCFVSWLAIRSAHVWRLVVQLP
jgi:hypothetical protein